MKSYFSLIISVIFLAWAVVSCKEIYENDYIAMSAEYFTFPPEGGIQYLEIVSTTSYTVSQTNVEWCIANMEYGKIAVEVMPNTDIEERSCTFNVTPSFTDEERVITVIQAPAEETVLFLSDTSSMHVFDATGGVYSFSIHSNASWTAEINSDYYTVARDESSMKITITAPINETNDSHNATLTITAGTGEGATIKNIVISQLTKDQSPYYKFVGTWDMYCTSWIYGQETISDGGTHTSCKIVEAVPGESYEIQGLFYQSGTTHTVIPAYFNPESGQMEIEVGEQTSLYIYGIYPVYLMMCNFETNSLLYDKLLTCTISENNDRINLEGFDSGYGWGIFPYMSGSYSRIADLYYAADDDSYFIRSEN